MQRLGALEGGGGTSPNASLPPSARGHHSCRRVSVHQGPGSFLSVAMGIVTALQGPLRHLPRGSDLQHCAAVVGPFRPAGPGTDSCIEGTTRAETCGPRF